MALFTKLLVVQAHTSRYKTLQITRILSPSHDKPVLKTDSDSFTAKCSAIGVSVMGPRR